MFSVVRVLLIHSLYVGATCIALYSQSLTNRVSHVECNRGVVGVNAADADRYGRIAVVGEDGRYGVLEPGSIDMRWECLANQVKLFAVYCSDSIIAVAGDSGNVWVDRNGKRLPFPLPLRSRVTAIHAFHNRLFAGTQDGEIWSISFDANSRWSRDYSAEEAIQAVDANDTILGFVGQRGLFCTMSANDRRWRRVSADTVSSIYSAIHITDSSIYIGTSVPSIITYSLKSGSMAETIIPARPGDSNRDHLGLPQRILSIDSRADTVYATGYFEPYRGTLPGIFRLTDSGKSIHKLGFTAGFEKLPLPLRLPLVQMYADTLMVVAASYATPITIYRKKPGTASTFTWNILTNLAEPVLNKDGMTLGWAETIFGGGIPSRDGDSIIAVMFKSAITGETSVETVVARIKPNGNFTTIDTIARIEGRVYAPSRLGNLIVAAGDYGRIVYSRDEGRSWRWSSDESVGFNYSLGVFNLIDLNDSIFVTLTSRGFVLVDTAFKVWTQIHWPSEDSLQPRVTSLAALGGSRYCAMVGYLKGSTYSHTRLFVVRIVDRRMEIERELDLPPDIDPQSSSVHFDRGIMTVLGAIPFVDNSGAQLWRFSLCSYRNTAWDCSPMTIETSNCSHSVFNFTPGEVEICDGVATVSVQGGTIYGVGNPRKWTTITADARCATTQSRGAVMGGRYFVFGSRHGLTSFDFTGVTSVDDWRRLDEVESELRSPEFTQDAGDLYSLDGRLVVPVDRVSINGLYLRRERDNRMRLVLIVNGGIVAAQN